ncbi:MULTISPECIES: hypothetical protein [Micrococcus]|uniref:Uncharacterized protein n=1 Tax=Micrococcus lylae TaxID=1273 RepID=A0ABY2JXG7_9MICC|nr:MULTISPECIES: hypothetical protein [Micrococcus]OFR90388.1 hypothetical protein HMPREF2863_06900 [Micrococcus sp. HMSC067E09]TFH98122.1 hypothetical protein E4A49_10035 [Micrococcus lylae]WIK81848.1 hypothetical protein CJ228_009630 [Micrococcus lylae]
MPDRYTYPGSDVLVNKFGVTDYDDWKDAEADFIGARMVRCVSIQSSADTTLRTCKRSTRI